MKNQQSISKGLHFYCNLPKIVAHLLLLLTSPIYIVMVLNTKTLTCLEFACYPVWTLLFVKHSLDIGGGTEGHWGHVPPQSFMRGGLSALTKSFGGRHHQYSDIRSIKRQWGLVKYNGATSGFKVKS